MHFGLEAFDELVGFVAGELAAGLALRETHRAAGVAEVAVSSRLEKLLQLTKLFAGRWRTGGLTKRHALTLPHRASTDAAHRPPFEGDGTGVRNLRR